MNAVWWSSKAINQAPGQLTEWGVERDALQVAPIRLQGAVRVEYVSAARERRAGLRLHLVVVRARGGGVQQHRAFAQMQDRLHTQKTRRYTQKTAPPTADNKLVCWWG